jgi:hypothetical protein
MVAQQTRFNRIVLPLIDALTEVMCRTRPVLPAPSSTHGPDDFRATSSHAHLHFALCENDPISKANSRIAS